METDEHPDDGDVVDLTAPSQTGPFEPEPFEPAPFEPAPIEVGRAEPAWGLPGASDATHAADATPDDPVQDVPIQDVAIQDDDGETVDGETDELAVLTAIEQDLAAVEEAMAGLDRIDADQVGGAAAATQVAAIVGSDRFAVDD